MKSVLYYITICIFFFLGFSFSVEARLTPEQKAARKQASEEADKKIDFVSHVQLESTVSMGTWLIFFGARWCPFTQKMTPKWLTVQEEMKGDEIEKKGFFGMRKVECADDESFCVKKHDVNGYPTLLLFKDGKMIEEYPDADEIDPLVSYIKKHVHLNRQEQEKQQKSASSISDINDQEDHHPVHPLKSEAKLIQAEEGTDANGNVKSEDTNNQSGGSWFPIIIFGGIFGAVFVAIRARSRGAEYSKV